MIIPSVRALYVCDRYVRKSSGNVDLYGVFNAIRPQAGFPYARAHFCVFAQLVNGLDRLPFFIEIRAAATDELVYSTATHSLVFPDRTTVVQMAMKIEGCVFESPGLYLVELYCNNQWVCDTQFRLT